MHPTHNFSPTSFPVILILSSYLSPALLNGLPIRFSAQILYAFLISYASHPSWFDHPNSIWWSMQVMKLLIMQSSSDFCHFV